MRYSLLKFLGVVTLYAVAVPLAVWLFSVAWRTNNGVLGVATLCWMMVTAWIVLTFACAYLFSSSSLSDKWCVTAIAVAPLWPLIVLVALIHLVATENRWAKQRHRPAPTARPALSEPEDQP